MRPAALLALSAALAACWAQDPLPRRLPTGPAGGYAPGDFDFDAACRSWTGATANLEAHEHVSFPELSGRGCFAGVRYELGPERIVGVDAPREGCGYPHDGAKEELLARAAVYERFAERTPSPGEPIPIEIACELPDDVRRATARANARSLRSLAASIFVPTASYPYAVAGTFGFGASAQSRSKLMPWRPGDACIPLERADRDLLDVNVTRAGRIAEAYRAGVAPLVSTSGGAVHGELVEAFMLGHLAHCDGGVPQDRILYDPCADHTHTNFRNTGAMVREMGARFAYLVTDDFLQSKYMQEWTVFEIIGGSIDQRALRDWGYLVGAWRQASRGIDAGFWYTPYRFWSEARAEAGSFACAGDVSFEPRR